MTQKHCILRLIYTAAVVLVMIGCTSVVVVSPLGGMPPEAPIERIKMTAQRYKFSPEIVHVKVGTHVLIEIEGLDVKHGFKVDRYGINIEIPAKGKGTVIAEFYARETNTYTFKCSHFCGIKHPWMTGKLVVEE